MKHIANALVCAGLLAAGAAAHAEGLSFGASLGSSHYKGDDIGGQQTDRSDTSYKIYGGWGFTPNFGLEAGWVDLGKFSSAAGSAKASGLYLDAVGMLPLGNNFSALGRLGLFNGKLENTVAGSDRGTNLKIGAGVQYDINAQLGVRGEWERYRFDAVTTKTNADLYSIGLNYKF